MSAVEIPHGKPFVFKMLNKGLDIQVEMDNYIVSDPKFALGDFNTEILIKPTLVSGYYGKHKFFYNRLDLFTLKEITLKHLGETQTHELLSRINEMGLLYIDDNSPLKLLDELNVDYFVSSEFINKPIPPLGNNDSTFVMLNARPNSYVFTGAIGIKLTRN